jgi:hypothetical protein
MRIVTGRSIEVIQAGHSVHAGRSRSTEGDAVAAPCCCTFRCSGRYSRLPDPLRRRQPQCSGPPRRGTSWPTLDEPQPRLGLAPCPADGQEYFRPVPRKRTLLYVSALAPRSAIRFPSRPVAITGPARLLVSQIKELAEYLGHADPAFTLRVYAHLLPSSHDRARTVINDRFGQLMGDPGAGSSLTEQRRNRPDGEARGTGGPPARRLAPGPGWLAFSQLSATVRPAR